MAEKNQQYAENQAKDILAPLFQQHTIDPDRPILAAISRYDIHKNQASILKAFKRLREEKAYDPAPYLIFLGNTAADDPEGEAMLAQLKAQAGDDRDIHFWVNVENNDQVVGSLMRLAAMPVFCTVFFEKFNTRVLDSVYFRSHFHISDHHIEK